MKIFNRKLVLKSPVQSDIVIFERIGSERIKDLIIPDLKAAVFDSSLEELFISARVFYYFILGLKHLPVRELMSLRQLGRQLWSIYVLSCLKCLKPKIVITLIDNHGMFHWLCEHYKKAEFMAIQNGSRTKVEFRGLKTPYRIGHYFCFGEYEKDLYHEHGHKIDHYYPIGSLLAGYYRPKESLPQYDLCVVSGWRGNIGNGPDVQRTMASMRKMDLLLSKYLKEYNLKAAIIMRSEPNSPDRDIPVYGDEKEYYKSMYPNSTNIIDPDFKERNIYKIMDQSGIIITSGSTAAREAFGWGKKVLYCDFTGTDLYNDYEPVILFTIDDYEAFKAKMNELSLMSYDEYAEKTKKYAAYLMSYNQAIPPHLFIRRKIKGYLA